MVLARQASGVIDERPADQRMEMSFFLTWRFHSLINRDYNLKLTCELHRLGLTTIHPAYHHLKLAQLEHELLGYKHDL